MLEAELDDHLGYERYDNKNKGTANSMESYNRLLIKVTKSKSVFPSDHSLHKSLYSATVNDTI